VAGLDHDLDSGLQGPGDVAAVWKQYGPPLPVEANHPLFIIFTSGTTGKPKGVLHSTAGYIIRQSGCTFEGTAASRHEA